VSPQLRLHSERFPPSGGLAAQGALNLLGRPEIDMITLLLRETGQNSWDAQRVEPVRFDVHLYEPNQTTQACLREQVFPETPTHLPLAEVLRQSRRALRLLAISDRGTVGLGGPTRADVACAPGEAQNFIEFMRNFGQVDNDAGSGGTYGYGRTSAYVASRANTLLVYTRWSTRSGHESRFMASALGQSFTHGGFVHTGRHWWGLMDSDGIAEPATGRDADELARNVGLHPMSGDETGTDLVVVDPILDDATDDLFDDHVRSALLWNFWPKMIGVSGRPEMVFTARRDGTPIDIPDPRDWPGTKLYATAYEYLTQPTKHRTMLYEEAAIERGRTVLGRIGMLKGLASSSVSDGSAAPYQRPHRHTVLLRHPRLVVKYLEAEPMEVEDLEYCGVFVASEYAEPVLAESETPVHDDWKAAGVTARADKILVNAVMSGVRKAMKDFASPQAAGPLGTSADGLGFLSDALGALLPGGEGDGASTTDRLSGASAPKPSARVHISRSYPVESPSGPGLVAVEFDVTAAEGSAGTRIEGRTGAALEDGSIEQDPPTGADLPELVAWRDPTGLVHYGSSIVVGATDRGSWTLHVTRIDDAAVGIELTPAVLE
jgi:hypothetical protein